MRPSSAQSSAQRVATCPGLDRAQRETDWGAELRDSGSFDVGTRIDVPWTRVLTVDAWVRDLSSHSFMIAMAPVARGALLDNLRVLAERAFPSGEMRVRYETNLWIATRR